MQRIAEAGSARKLSRRQYLKRSGKAFLAGAVLPWIVPSNACASSGDTAPNSRIAVGLVGIGAMMRGLIDIFLERPQVQVAAVCDVESVRVGLARDKVDGFYAERSGQASYRGCTAYTDFRDLLARDDIDAVVIATPDHWHALIAIAALDAGKDVYCEKPLSLTINEGQAMVEATRRNGRVFQTGSQQRSELGFRVACELVRNGRIGKVNGVLVSVTGPSVECHLPEQPAPPGLDWDMWLGPAPWRPYNYELAPDLKFTGFPNWRSYRDYSGGGMTDWGAHHFDIAQWGLGMDGSGPVEICPPDGKSHRRLTYVYKSNVVMERTEEQRAAGVEFIGDLGRVMVNRGYLETDPPSLLQEPLRANDVHLYESRGHQDDWLDCIRTRSKPICDVAVGHRSASVCHLGNIAYRTGRPLRWDPETERFIDDDEADRLLQRPMRSPWCL